MTTNQNQRCHHTIYERKQIVNILSCLQNMSSCFGIFENNKKHTEHLDNTDLPIWDKTAAFFPCCLLREGVIIALPRTHRQQHFEHQESQHRRNQPALSLALMVSAKQDTGFLNTFCLFCRRQTKEFP